MKNLFSLTTLNLIKTTCISMIKDYPMFCRLELTSKCNFRCEFCHMHRKNNIKQDMTTEQIITVIDALSNAGTSFLYITGGEPLIRQDIDVILKHAKQKNMYVLLGTNGSLFKQKFNKIAKYIDVVHFSLQSINNFESITSCKKEIFDDVIESIKIAKKQNILRQINVCIDKNNIEEMFYIAEFINKNFDNVPILYLFMELLSPNKQDNLDMKYLVPDLNVFNKNLLQIQSKYKNINVNDRKIGILKKQYALKNREFCKAGNNMIVVNSQGQLEYPCEFMKLKIKNISSKDDIKNFLKNTNKKFIKDEKIKFCKKCTNSCYTHAAYFLTVKGFFSTVKNMLFN